MRLTVRAPATVANLGPGFDCLAMALDLSNEFTVDTETEPGVSIEGEGAGELPGDGTNLVFRTMTYLVGKLGGRLPPMRLVCRNRIPLQRGLGSSASAVVGGLLLADRLLGAGLPSDRLLAIAADLEGHADNVSACLRGGITVAYLAGGGWRAERLEAHPDLRATLLIPTGERMITEDARRVIPRTVPVGDAVFNVGRVALAVLAMTERPALVGAAVEDRLHQPYRLPLMPAARALFQDLRDEGFAVCVAGSGPSLLVLGPSRSAWDLGPGWVVLRPEIATAGAAVREEAGTGRLGED